MTTPSPICVRLGTLHFDLVAHNASVREILLDRFHGFLRPDPKPSPLTLEIFTETECPRGSVETPAISGFTENFIAEESFLLHYRKSDRSVAWVTGRRTPRVEDPIVTTLLHYVSLACIDHGGLLLHAGAIVTKNGAFVFPGKSGAGKSTLAAMFAAEDVLNDEFVIVEGDRVASTPFFGTSMHHRRGRWRCVGIDRFLDLEHQPSCSWRRLSASEGFEKLARCIAVPITCLDAKKRSFALIDPNNPWFAFGFCLDAEETRRAMGSPAIR